MTPRNTVKAGDSQEHSESLEDDSCASGTEGTRSRLDVRG